MTDSGEVTRLLEAWKEGDNAAFENIFPLVIRELRQIARAHLRREEKNHTLQTSALVNEAYLKLIDQRNAEWKSRSHFFAIASKIMRRILLDYAKTRLREKRGGGTSHLCLDEIEEISFEKSKELVALDEALNRLAEFDPLKSRIVEMRHFGGMSVDETAEALTIAPVTVIRHWNLAKAWLRREIEEAL